MSLAGDRKENARKTQGVCNAAYHYAWRQLDLNPWREEAHRQIIRVLALRGERSAALARYERCRRVLLEEVGIELAEATTTLYERIRDEVGEGRRADSSRPLPGAGQAQLPRRYAARRSRLPVDEVGRYNGALRRCNIAVENVSPDSPPTGH